MLNIFKPDPLKHEGKAAEEQAKKNAKSALDAFGSAPGRI